MPNEPEPVDTGERATPPGIRTSDERTMLIGMLDWYRAGVLNKVAGAAQDVVAARPGRSETSIGGVLKHLAAVEDGWFTIVFAGQPAPAPWDAIDWDSDPNWEWRTGGEDPLADTVALYEAACARSRAVTAAHSLDDIGADTETKREPFTLRWVLVHLLEETARHLGHMDILREQLDGTTGE